MSPERPKIVPTRLVASPTSDNLVVAPDAPSE